MTSFCIIDLAHIPLAGNFDPFADGTQSGTIDDISSNESHPVVNLPSLDVIHDHVHAHQSSETNETVSVASETLLKQAGPSLDMIDSHPHSHDDEDSSILDSAKRSLIQPSIDFLDAQLHGGDEHVHDHNRTDTDEVAADLDDFQRWLKEQNQTNQLNRFILLQKEMNRFHFNDTQDLNEKLNRTIEQLKLAKQRAKYDL